MKKVINIICTTFLIALFLYAAYFKIQTFQEFIHQLDHSPYFKNNGTLVAWIVPSLEIGIVLCLIFNRSRLVGLYSSFILLLLFTLYIYLLLHFSESLPCGCGGIISKLSWSQHFWFNLLFLGLAVTGILTLQSSKTKNMHASESPT